MSTNNYSHLIFDEGVKKTNTGEHRVSSTNGAGKTWMFT